MVVLVLVLVWLAVLTPWAWRKMVERNVSTSVASFRYGLGRLSRARVATGAEPLEAARPFRSNVSVDSPRHRNQQTIERRRRVLLGFGAVILATFTFGAIPALRPLWYLSLTALILACGYVAMLAYVVRNELLADERHNKVVSIAPSRPVVMRSSTRAIGEAANLRPLQPAFKILDAPVRRAAAR